MVKLTQTQKKLLESMKNGARLMYDDRGIVWFLHLSNGRLQTVRPQVPSALLRHDLIEREGYSDMGNDGKETYMLTEDGINECSA